MKKILFLSLNLVISIPIYCTETTKIADIPAKTTIDFKKIYGPVSVAIIGGGIAGMSASIYLSRAKEKYVLIEGSQNLGGQLVQAYLKNWPGTESIMGADLALQIIEQLTKFGTPIIKASVEEITQDDNHMFVIKLNNGETVLTKSVIIATGAKQNKLNVPGEDEFQMAVCANCDAPQFEGKKVIIIGGGYEALRELPMILKYTDDITIINKNTDISGPKMLRNYAIDNKNIKLLNNTTAIGIVGKDGKATGVKIRDNSTGTESTIEADGVFSAIGWQPSTDFCKKIVERNSKGEIITKNTASSKQGVFAAGDASSESYHQALPSAAQGYEAAMNAEKLACLNETEDINLCK